MSFWSGESLTSASYTGSSWVVYLAGRFIYGSQYDDQFIWSAQDDPATISALDFATAESSVDGIVTGIKYREELWLFGASSIEVWRPSENADAAFEKNQSVSISVGCAAGHSVVNADNTLLFIGQDTNGGAVIYQVAGYAPRRVSNHAVEQALRTSTDIASSTAFVYQMDGHVFVSFNCPGLDTTWVYDITTAQWHERAEYTAGAFSKSRATCHIMIDGDHIVGSSTGLYKYDEAVFTNGSDVLCRERTSPHYAVPSMNTVFFSRLRLDCSVGGVVASTKYVQLYYSNDGGATYTASALQRSLGETGERRTMVQWNRLGSARDRVWKIRCTDDVFFDIVNVDVQAEEGTS